MFLALGLIISVIAYFITNEGMSAVLQIMFCAFLLHYMFGKKTTNNKKEKASSFSEYMSMKYGDFRESPKQRRKLTEEEKITLNNRLRKWRKVVSDLESDYWLEAVKLHLKELNTTKGISGEPNYSMMYYQEVRQKLLHEAKGNIYSISIALK